MRNTLKYDENKMAFEPKYGRTYEKYRFEKVFLIRYLFDYLSFIEKQWEYEKCKWKIGFFVKFGGKFFSAHLANSVSAYIFLWKWVKRDNY